MFPEGFIPRKQEVVAEAWYRSGGAGGPLGLPDTGERRTDDGRPVSGPGRDVDHAAHSDAWSHPVSLRRAVLTLCLVGVTAGCSEPRPGRTPEATPASASASGPSLPLAAGADVVRAVHRLPDGPADGTIVVSYNGLGELRGDLHGECAHEGNATTITGSSSTARLTISFDGTGAHLELTDVGLTQSSQLAAGSYQVDPPRLVVNTQLLGGGALAGTLSLDVVCDGAAG
jgi:hypothetical protein